MIHINIIDHYDSFSFNLINWLQATDKHVVINYYSFDDKNLFNILYKTQHPLVLSPGPKAPRDIPQTTNLAAAFLGKVPILGICLGHQVLLHVTGHNIELSANPFHGSTRQLKILERGNILKNYPDDGRVAIYNSLAVHNTALNNFWNILAIDEQNEIQAIEASFENGSVACGLQFHPESFMTEHSEIILNNWLEIIERWQIKQNHLWSPNVVIL